MILMIIAVCLAHKIENFRLVYHIAQDKHNES